jgi:hypothetical protein
MSKESFLAVEESFHLPPSTIESIFSCQGTYSRRFEYSDPDSGALKSVGLVIKAPQKMPIGNYVLALSHNLSTKVTLAFIFGQYIHSALPTMKFSILQQPRAYRSQFENTDDEEHSQDRPEIQSAQILARLRRSVAHWTHPFLLPVLLLENYMSRSHFFAWDLDDHVVFLERETGVVFAGRTIRERNPEVNVRPEMIPREKIQQLTRDMHSLVTEIIFFERVVVWIGDCAGFLEKKLMELNEGVMRPQDREILEFIEFLTADSKCMVGMQKSLKERMQNQINVVSNIFFLNARTR